MARDREPWVKFKIGLRRSDKVGNLPKPKSFPGDSVKLGWHYVLLEAKLQRRMGVFAGREHFEDVLGKYGTYLDHYVAAGLAEVAPALCERCAPQYTDVRAGEIVVHDYRREQRDPTAQDRQDRRRKPGDDDPQDEPDLWEGEANVTALSRRSHGAQRDNSVTSGVLEGGQSHAVVTALSRSMSRSRHADVTADSRARGTTATATAREGDTATQPSPARATAEQPRLTRAQLDAWAGFTAPEWAPFKAAWLDRGLLHPPSGSAEDDDTSQRGLLWQIAQDRPRSLGEWVTEAKGKSARSVVDHVLRRWHDVRGEAEATDLAHRNGKVAELEADDELDFTTVVSR